jgi:hypothetical protein
MYMRFVLCRLQSVCVNQVIIVTGSCCVGVPEPFCSCNCLSIVGQQSLINKLINIFTRVVIYIKKLINNSGGKHKEKS